MKLIYKVEQDKNYKQFFLILGVFLVAFLLFHNFSYARELDEVVQTAQAKFNRIGISAIGIGMTLGGILYAIGLGQAGRFLLISGGIGACAILGTPIALNMLGKFFGVSF